MVGRLVRLRRSAKLLSKARRKGEEKVGEEERREVQQRSTLPCLGRCSMPLSEETEGMEDG